MRSTIMDKYAKFKVLNNQSHSLHPQYNPRTPAKGNM